MKIELLYIGKRMRPGSNGLLQCFLHGDEVRSWTGIKGVHIGHVYIGGEKNKGMFIKSRPESVRGQTLDEKQITKYEAEERSAIEQYRQIRERKLADKEISALARSKKIKALIELLKPIVKDMKYFEAEFFVDNLIREARK